MLCPKCFSEVQIVNNSVYCPNCKIYLAESVDRFRGLYNQKELQEQKASFGTVSGNIQRKLNFEKYKSKLKSIFILFVKIVIPLIIIAGIFYGFLNLGSSGYREVIFRNYGFTEQAKWYLRLTTFFSVGEPNNKHLPYNYVHSQFNPSNRSIFVGSANDELAIHEIGHAWWFKVNQRKDFKKNFFSDFIRLSREKDINYENASLFAMALRLTGFCNCPNDAQINLDSVDVDHLFVNLAAFTMGRFKDGDRKLPPYMWPYLGTMFTGKVKVATCYELGNCEHIHFDKGQYKKALKEATSSAVLK